MVVLLVVVVVVVTGCISGGRADVDRVGRCLLRTAYYASVPRSTFS